uniref:Msx2-interacting protein (inferred by orthology to a human protein) n=1 Tax=Anisakis simplex TaxID=6269 RepID=A0A0M3JUV6_ANISI
LYVGGLERRVSDDSLRVRFGHFGHILDIDVKNWESPSPFAFIQFADIQSVVRAINAYNGGAASSGVANSGSHAGITSKNKFKTNWGRTIVTNKIWIGGLPASCSQDYIREKIRVSFTDTFNELIYDRRWNEALLLFVSNDSAQRALTMIKTKQITFWNDDEKRDVHVPVDYCSEKLHDYFVDRKFRADKESATTTVATAAASSALCTNAATSELNLSSSGTTVVASSFGAGSSSSAGAASSAAVVPSTSSLLAPPPDPPSHLRDTSR